MANLPPPDPLNQPRTDLPSVARGLPPERFQRGFQWEERLLGLGLLLLGLVGLGFVALVTQSGGLPGAPAPPPPPPGLRGVAVPSLITVTTVLMPILAIGSLALVVIGLRRLLSP